MTFVLMHQFRAVVLITQTFTHKKKQEVGLLSWPQHKCCGGGGEVQVPTSLVDRGRMFLGLPDFVL